MERLSDIREVGHPGVETPLVQVIEMFEDAHMGWAVESSNSQVDPTLRENVFRRSAVRRVTRSYLLGALVRLQRIVATPPIK